MLPPSATEKGRRVSSDFSSRIDAANPAAAFRSNQVAARRGVKW